MFGSIAFGLEALLLGLGGRLSVLYRRDRKRVLEMASLVGLAVVSSSIMTSALLGFGPLYFCASVLIYTLIASGIFNLLGAKLIKPSPLLLPSPTADEEIEQMLQKHGFKGLMKKERK
jgi:hypothetical protein